MNKKNYMKPSTEVVEIDMKAQVLTTSILNSVSTNGLGDDNLKLPDSGDDITGSIIDAM